MFWIGLAIGFFVGGMVAYFTCALMVTSKQSDRKIISSYEYDTLTDRLVREVGRGIKTPNEARNELHKFEVK